MSFKLTFGIVLGLICAAETAQARSDIYLYGAVPVAGDPQLMLAYDNAKAWCSLNAVDVTGSVRTYPRRNGSPALRGCLSRFGFVYQSGEPYAYPVRKLVYVSK